MPKSKNYEFHWGERHSMISIDYWMNAYGPYALGKPRAIDFLAVSEKKYLDTYASKLMTREWKDFSKVLLRKQNRIKLLKSTKGEQVKYFQFFNKFQKLPLTKLDNTTLLKLLREYMTILQRNGIYFAASQPEGIDAITGRLNKLLKEKQASHLLSVLITPTEPDIIFREQSDLYKLAKRQKVKNDELYKHALKHAWLFFNSYDIRKNLEFLRLRLKDKFNAQQKYREWASLKRRQRVIFRGLKNPEIKELCLFLQKISIERFEAKNCWAGAEFRFLPLFQEIAKRIKVPFRKMMATYTLSDYKRALMNGTKLADDVIRRRLEGFVFWKKGQKVYLIENQLFLKKTISEFKNKINAPQIITGIPANPGKARGRARLVQSIDINQVLKDLARFNQGDILITWMTQPNMVPIVKKAAAIIADEGGITSHAAIVAREFKIPCIVGTRVATKILKNGDMLEVDADRGSVRKI